MNSNHIRLATALIAAAWTAGATVARAEKQPAAAKPTSPESSLVRVNSTLQSYNFIRPWEKGAPTPRRGLGALLPDGRVLVTAELTVNSTYIELEHPATGEKAPAKILGRDYEVNLALLAPADKNSKILDDLVPLKLNQSVKAGDELEVWQIEDNGDGVRTDVEVLRAAVNRYFLESAVFLVYEVKGSLQARANSFTLPVTKGGSLAGLLLSYNSKEQTSNILPAPIIQAFLDDIDDGAYQGFPTLGIAFDETLDDQLRRFTGIAGKEGGIFVRQVAIDSSADKGGLKEGDVIMKINGHAIDSRGYYDDKEFGKLNFGHLVRGGAKAGDVVKVDIVRDREPKTLNITLERKLPGDYLIDPYMFDRGPRYMIMGGLIFQELTQPYLKSWGDEWATRAPFRLVYADANPEKFEEEGREKLVFLAQVLKTESSIGYEGLNSIIVTKVNGKPIRDLLDLSDALRKPGENGIHKIEFDSFPKVIFLDDQMARAVNQLLIQYGISQLERLN